MEMQKHLPQVDMDKLRIVLDTKERYMNGELSLEDARAILREKVKTLRPYEIALAEQELKTFQDDECRKEDIQQMMTLYTLCSLPHQLGRGREEYERLEWQHPTAGSHREATGLGRTSPCPRGSAPPTGLALPAECRSLLLHEYGQLGGASIQPVQLAL